MQAFEQPIDAQQLKETLERLRVSVAPQDYELMRTLAKSYAALPDLLDATHSELVRTRKKRRRQLRQRRRRAAAR